MTLLTTLIVQVILQLRVYALYDKSKKILALLLTLCVIEVAIMAILVGITIGQLQRKAITTTTLVVLNIWQIYQSLRRTPVATTKVS